MSLRSNQQTISNASAVLKAMEGNRKSRSQAGERAKRAVQLCPRASLILSRLLRRVDANQIRAKSTDGAFLKQRGGDSVVRSCCGTLKGMVLGFEGGIVGSTYGANETQHRNRVDLEITQSLNQTFGRSVDFQHALDEFVRDAVQRRWCPSGPIIFPTYLACRTICISRNSAQFSEIQVLRDASSSLPY